MIFLDESYEKSIRMAKAGWEIIPIWKTDATEDKIKEAKALAQAINAHLPRPQQ